MLSMCFITMVDRMLEALLKASRKAAKYLRTSKRSSKIVGLGSFGDVTKVFDKEAEDIIVNILRKEFGNNILIVSEEMGVSAPIGKPKYVFIIDPVDGSTNYDAGIPWVSISIGGARWKKGGVRVKDLETAVVYDVFGGKAYAYSIYDGVKINDLHAIRRDPPAKVLLGYFEVPEAYEVVTKYFRFRGSREALRSLGSAALDIVQVGLGNAEAFIDARAKLRNVDVAASLRIATALGAEACTCSGKSALEIKTDELVKVECVGVGYDKEKYEWAKKALSP